MLVLSSVGKQLLSNRSFDIEFNGFLSNHVKHAVIALEGLGASPERVQGYWNEYTELTPYQLPLHKADDWTNIKPCSLSQWLDWRGRKVHWQEQVVFMNRELEERFDGDTDRLVREYVGDGDLLAGQAGALTHGIIHLGWAIDANSPWMITEGLAYLNFCHLGVDESHFTLSEDYNDETCLWESLSRVAKTFETENLDKVWVQQAKNAYDKTFHAELVAAGFQWQLSKVLHDVHPVATQLPLWLQSTPLETVWESLYKDVVRLYVATRDEEGHGSFLVLHLITSLWGLEHTVGVIGKEGITRRALYQYYSMAICILATSGFPASSVFMSDDSVIDGADGLDFDWGPLVKEGTAEVEEHNIKLVYTARELWQRYGRWSGFSLAAKSFTLTPNIGPSSNSGYSGSSS